MIPRSRPSVALVALNAPPRNTPESLQVGRYSRELAERCDTILVTARRVDSWAPEDTANSRADARFKHIIETPLPERRVLGALSRRSPINVFPDEDLTWLLRAPVIASRLRATGVTHVYSRATPHASSLMGLLLARRLCVPWVMHLSDPWLLNPFRVSNRISDHSTARLESACFREATKICVTSESTRSAYSERYPAHAHKLLVFPNVYGAADPEPASRVDGAQWNVVHTGRLYGSRSPRQFLASIERFLHARPEARARSRVLFAGFVDADAERALSEAPPPVEFLGPVDYRRARQLQSEADLLVAIDAADADTRYDLFFPSKLLDYMAARRPVVALTRPNSETARFLAQGLGTSFAHHDVEGVARHLTERWDAFVSRPTQCPTPGPLLEMYSAAFQGARLCDLLLTL